MKRFPRSALVASLLFFTLSVAPLNDTLAADFKREVVYQIITDRFFDGNAANNNPSQSAGLYDTTKTSTSTGSIKSKTEGASVKD